MALSIFLARFWGWFLLFEAVIYLVRMNVFLERLKDKGFALLDGYLSLTFGLATVIAHNHWSTDWRVLVTLLGWFFVLRGVARLAFPEQVSQKLRWVSDRPMLLRIMLLALALFCAVLLWVSWEQVCGGVGRRTPCKDNRLSCTFWRCLHPDRVLGVELVLDGKRIIRHHAEAELRQHRLKRPAGQAECVTPFFSRNAPYVIQRGDQHLLQIGIIDAV